MYQIISTPSMAWKGINLKIQLLVLLESGGHMLSDWERRGKTIFWCFLTVLISLIQYWVLLFFSFLGNSQAISITAIISDCALIFFSTTIATSFAIDFFVFEKNHAGKAKMTFQKIGLLYVLFPGVILVISILIYCYQYFSPKTQVHTNNLISAQIVICILSLIYAYYIKQIQTTIRRSV
jgi:hypothetical protein